MKTCYVEKIVSKVIIIACDYLLVSKMPKRRGRNGDNRLFSPKTMILTIMNKSPWDGNAIFIFFCYSAGSLIKQRIFFVIFLQISLPLPYIKLKLGRNSG